jgi:hypothetical protein
VGTLNRRADRMANLFDSMEFVRRRLERADAVVEDDLRVPRNVSKGERLRRERVAARMRIDPAFVEFTAEAQEQLIRAALTDSWDAVLPRLPRMRAE